MMDWSQKPQNFPNENYPYYSWVKIFNHLSNDIKNLPFLKPYYKYIYNHTIFKRKLISYLIEKCFYNR